MLEDHNIQHLISWSSSNESFVMSPTSEFSKVLAYVLGSSLAARQGIPPSANVSIVAGNTLSTPTFLHSFDS
jgi:hypothetical protein